MSKPPVVLLCGGKGTRLREETELRQAHGRACKAWADRRSLIGLHLFFEVGDDLLKSRFSIDLRINFIHG